MSTPTPEILKSCPFCGEMPTIHPYDNEMVACTQGDCPMSDAGTCTRESWNTRPANPLSLDILSAQKLRASLLWFQARARRAGNDSYGETVATEALALLEKAAGGKP